MDIGIDEFLKPFKQGRPPIILSDGFPSEYLPRPLIRLADKDIASLDEYAKQKRIKKSTFYEINDFIEVCKGGTLPEYAPENPWVTGMTPHASLDRNTLSTAGEGSFFETEYTTYSPGQIRLLDIYVRCQEEWFDKIEILFKACSKAGFGRDKSIGMGSFRIMEIEPFNRFRDIDGANGFVNLSSMVPARDDPTDAFYRIRTKYGKIGEGVSVNPFKSPLIQIEPGAVFRIHGVGREYYGQMIDNIAPGDEKVVQNCYCFPVPCMFDDKQ